MQDCECVGLKIRVQVNGENVAMDLEEILMLAGTPKGIVKDRDATRGDGCQAVDGGAIPFATASPRICCSRVMTSRTVRDLLSP